MTKYREILRMDAQSPMALIMVGQNELRNRLQLQSFAAIRQRIDIHSGCIIWTVQRPNNT